MSFKDKGLALGYKNLHNVNSVIVNPTERGFGIAKNFYKWLIGNDILVLGDREQYFGARILWAALSQDLDVEVDIVDFEKLSVIDTNVVLHHGKYDSEFDQRVWSYGDQLQHVRLVLRGMAA